MAAASRTPPFSMTRYNAEISAGSLLPLESRRVAALLLTQPHENEWVQAIEVQNILQKRTPATARRQATLIRKRLLTLTPQTLEMIATRESEVSVQLLLTAAIKHSQLLGDFLRNTYWQQQRRFEAALSGKDWQDFLAESAHHDPSVLDWSDSTKKKLFEVICRILVESRFLDATRTKKMTPPSLHPAVIRYLRENHETYALQCMEKN
jgi:hypothetical protein